MGRDPVSWCRVCAAGAAAHAAGLLPPPCPEHPAGDVRVIARRGPFHFYGTGALVMWLLGLLGSALVALVLAVARHPWWTAGAFAAVVVWRTARDQPTALAPFGLVAAGLVLTWRYTPDAYERFVGRPVRSRWRRAMIYRREWQPAMAITGLDRGEVVPRVRRVVAEPGRDTVHVRDRVNTLTEWQAAIPRLARVFGVRSLRVRVHPRHRDTFVLTARRHRAPTEAGGDPRPQLERPSPELIVSRPEADIPQVTKPDPEAEPQPATPRPGAFPRAPRRAL